MTDNVESGINIFHIDPEKSWRGGQQQVAYLHEELIRRGISSWVICRPKTPLESWLQKRKLPYISIPMRNEMDFISGWRIANEARKRNVSILQLHSSHAIAQGLWASFFFSDLNLVAMRRVAVPIKRNFLSKLKYKSNRISKHIAISEAVRKQMITDGITPERIQTIHDGIDIDRLNVYDEHKRNQVRNSLTRTGNIVVGTIAALTKEKGYDTLLKIAHATLQKNHSVSFCAVGDGVLKEQLEELATSLNISKNFHFLGFQKDIMPFINSFDIFILTSENEGLGTSILDAQAVGLPVLASNVGGIPEIIDDGVNGFLAPARDIQSFSEKLEKLIMNADIRTSIGQNAIQTVRKFSIQKTVDKSIELYGELNKCR